MTASPTFQPAWWLPNPHLQTLWSPFFRRGPTLERQRERLWLADGDFIDLDWAGPHDAETPLVLALHGLTGHPRRTTSSVCSAPCWSAAGPAWR